MKRAAAATTLGPFSILTSDRESATAEKWARRLASATDFQYPNLGS